MGRVVIVGAGSFGRAIEHVLKNKRGAQISLWDKDPRKAPGQESLEETLPGAQAIFVCVNSWAVREALHNIRDMVDPEAVIVSPTKGIERKTLLTADQLLAQGLRRGQAWSLMGGPMLAQEMTENRASFAIFASRHKAAREKLTRLFAGTTVRAAATADVRGVALGGVLKNVYALGLGMVQGAGFQNNVRGAYVADALAEMAEVTALMGGKRATALSLAGLGDLVATGFSDSSRNCRVGREIAKLGECTTASEGLESLPQVLALLKAKKKHFRLLSAIARIALDKKSAKATLEAYGWC